MLFELRTYDYAPGDALRYLEIFAAEGLPLITRHLPLAGYWLSEVGVLNRLRHLWVYRDLADRAGRRRRLMSDTEWTKDFLPRGMALIRRQVNQLIVVDELSDTARAIVAAADRSHGGRAAIASPLREDWASLSDTRRSGALFTGHVMVGHQAGETVSISADNDLPATELMRPCIFSPL